MTQLTREHFEESFKGLAKASDIEDLRTHIDASIASLEKKVDDGFEGVDIKLGAIHDMLDVRKRVDRLEQQMAALQGHR